MLDDYCNDHTEIIEQARLVLSRQRGKKADAILHLLVAYEVLVQDVSDGIKYYSVMDGVVCPDCNTTLLKRRSPLGLYTTDGNPIYYCIKCKKYVSAKKARRFRSVDM